MQKPAVELWFELETRCNLACAFCYNFWKDGSAPEPRRQTTEATVAALRRLLNEVDCRLFAFSGGEPLLRPDLLELVRCVAEFGIPSVLTTNGTLLTRDKITQLLHAGIQAIQVPIHSHKAAVHDRLSGGASWEAAIRAIIRVREAGARITPVFVATRLNIRHFPQTLALCAQLSVRDIIFNRFVPSGLGNLNASAIGIPDDDELLDVLTKAYQTPTAVPVTIHVGMPIQVSASLRNELPTIQWASCPVELGQRRWTIGADLRLRRCNQSGESVGTLLDGGVLKLRAELDHHTDYSNHAIRSCNILRQRDLVQIGLVGQEANPDAILRGGC